MVWMLWWVLLLLIVECCWAVFRPGDNEGSKQWLIYTRDELLGVRDAMSSQHLKHLKLEFKLDDLNTADDFPTSRGERYKPKRRRGRRAGVHVRNRRRGNRPVLPTIIYGNVRSIRNKTDEFAANCKYNREFRDTSFICMTETWLESKDSDGTVLVDNFNLVRSDRSTGRQGGGVCIFINERWCKNVTVKDTYCDGNIEYLVVACRPFYLPREFGNVYITVAYVPPSGDYDQAVELLTNCVQNMDNKCPNGINILLGDFNGCQIADHIPNYYQYVKCSTRGHNTLDLVFCNIKNAYKVLQRKPLGNSDHNMLYCLPTYVQKLKSNPCKQITIKQWSEDNTDTLKDCFECTDWDVLYDECNDLEYNVDVCTSYIKFCIDLIIPTKKVTVFANNKPWVNKHVKAVINKKKAALSNDRNGLREIQKELNKMIKGAKEQYRDKIENLFKTNNSKDAWKGLKQLSGFGSKCCLPEPDDIHLYVNELNAFYARFDDKDFHNACIDMLNLIDGQMYPRIVLSEEEVVHALNRAKPGKASGPDKICSRVIKTCRRELVKPMLRLFQISLDLCIVPIQWKTSEVIPVPKVNIPLVKNDLRPVALTDVLMKCFESIVKSHLCKQVNHLMDKFQFAYRQNRCVEDAVNSLLDVVCCHLDKKKTYCRILYIDFSSAFNTIQPHILYINFLK